MIAYRREIDGLRAVAVAAVILFHAHVPGFSGGYIGVDVFFVISGFLITSIIYAEIQKKKFSILRFYERRIRRIFPALLVMIFVTFMLGIAVKMPHDLVNLGYSTAAALLFVSNILFWRQADYFDAIASEKPLLHTWSLAVEEQFYIFLPLFLLLLARYMPKRLLPVTAIAALGSFVLCLILTPIKPEAAFFLAPTRFWELMIGSLLALGLAPKPRSALQANIGVSAGMAAIAIACVLYDKGTAFPGVAAALPALGAALVIWGGEMARTPVRSFLAAAPSVFVGKLSYSLYLWHFPIFAYAEYLTVGAHGPVTTTALLGLTTAFAYLSWRYVERPFRQSRPEVPARRVVAVGSAAIAGFAAIALVVPATGGLPQRFGDDMTLIVDGALDRDFEYRACTVADPGDVTEAGLCRFGAPAPVVADTLVWGNSHASALAGGLAAAAERKDAAFYLATYPACPNSDGLHLVPAPAWASRCAEFNDAVLDFAIRSPEVTRVVFVSRWMAERYALEDRNVRAVYYGDDDAEGVDVATSMKIFERGFERAVKRLHDAGIDIWIVGPVPDHPYHVPKAHYLKSMGLVSDDVARVRLDEFMTRYEDIFRIFESVDERYDVNFVWPHEKLCDRKGCRNTSQGRPLYYDANHPSGFGAAWLSNLFEPIFE